LFGLRFFADQTKDDHDHTDPNRSARDLTDDLHQFGRIRGLWRHETHEKKKPRARAIRTKPVVTTLQFRFLIMLSSSDKLSVVRIKLERFYLIILQIEMLWKKSVILSGED
jgi:hypothetical protein